MSEMWNRERGQHSKGTKSIQERWEEMQKPGTEKTVIQQGLIGLSKRRGRDILYGYPASHRNFES